MSRVVTVGRGFGLLPWGAFVRSSALLVGLAALGLACARLVNGFSLPAFEAMIASNGPWGAWLFLGLATVAVAIGAPRQAVAFIGAYLFGFWPGFALGLASSVLSAALDFGWARGVGRATVKRRIGGRLAKIDHFLAKNPFNMSLMLRLLPIGNNVLISLVSGVSGMSAVRFLLGSAVGYVPQTVVFALLGTGTRLDRGSELAVAIGLFAASAVLGIVLVRRQVGSFRLFGLAKSLNSLSEARPDDRHGDDLDR